MDAAERFARGEKTSDVAAELRVGVRQVEKWRKAWREGGTQALRSKGPHAVERLSPGRWEGWSGSSDVARWCTAGMRTSAGRWAGSAR